MIRKLFYNMLRGVVKIYLILLLFLQGLKFNPHCGQHHVQVKIKYITWDVVKWAKGGSVEPTKAETSFVNDTRSEALTG